MRKVIQHESKTYLAPMPVEEWPEPVKNINNYLQDWYLRKSSWIECTGFEIGQEVPEGEWEMRDGVACPKWNVEDKFTTPETGETIFTVSKVSKYDVEATDRRSRAGVTTFSKSYISKVAIPIQQPEREEVTNNVKSVIMFDHGNDFTIEDLPSGSLFIYNGTIAMKSEYRTSKGACECYILDAGCMFWGGKTTAEELNQLVVQSIYQI